MEKVTKENYQEHVASFYKPYQEECMNLISSLNNTVNLHGYKDIPDITIRCLNANTRAVKYFKKFNLNYYDHSQTNIDRPIMDAVECFLFESMIEGKLFLSSYVREMDKISLKILNSPRFKINKKFGKQIVKLTGNPPDYSKYYTDLSPYMDAYLSYVKDMTEFKIEEKIEDVLSYYLPFYYNKILKTKYDEDAAVNLLIANRLFMSRVYCINNSLNKIGRQDLVPKTLSEAEKLMREKLEEEQNKYNEEQAENKKRNRTKENKPS